MEFQQLRYFKEVAEQQHVTRAAEKLFVSQSAVSRAISQLEEELGFPLFYRQKRSIMLSPFGAEFLEYVDRAFTHLDTGKRIVREKSGTEMGIVSLGFLHSLGVELVPQLIKKYRVKYPQVQFNLVQGSGERLISELERGNIDLCLSVPGMFDQDGLEWKHLFDEELVVALPSSHRFVQRRTIRLADIATDPFLALSPGHTLRKIFDQLCVDARITPQIAFESLEIATLRGMVAAGLGIAVLPVAPAGRSGVEEVRLNQVRPVRPLGIGWYRERPLSASALAFREFTVRTIASK